MSDVLHQWLIHYDLVQKAVNCPFQSERMNKQCSEKFSCSRRWRSFFFFFFLKPRSSSPPIRSRGSRWSSAYSLLSTYRLSLTEQRERMWGREGQSSEGSVEESSILQWCNAWSLSYCVCVCVILFVSVCVAWFIRWHASWVRQTGPFPFQPSTLKFSSPQPLTTHPLHAPHPLRELPPAPWWRRKACWVVAVSPRAAGQRRFDLRTRTDAGSSATPPLGVITSCHPSHCQVGA